MNVCSHFSEIQLIDVETFHFKLRMSTDRQRKSKMISKDLQIHVGTMNIRTKI